MDLDALGGLLAAAFAAAVMLLLERNRSEAWTEREVETSSWRPLPFLRAAAAAAAGVAAGILTADTGASRWAVSASAAAVTSLILLVVDTDIVSKRIPFEPCYAATAAGLGLGFAGGTTAGAIATGLAVLFVGLVWLIGKVTSGLGMGDTRLLLSIAAGSAWWVGFQPIMGMLLVACLVQLFARAVLAGHRLASGKDVKLGFLPFAPALAAGALLSLGLAASTNFGPCQDWPSGITAQCSSAQLGAS